MSFKIVYIFILYSLFVVFTYAETCSLPCSDCESIGAVCCEGHCAVLSGVGESCSSCPGCASGLACINGTCLYSFPGCPCASSNDCVYGQICISQQTCQFSGLNKGDACIETSQCQQGLVCKNNVCIGSKRINDTCDLDTGDCQRGLFCNNKGVCQKRKPNAMQCEQDYECQSFYCDSVCKPQDCSVIHDLCTLPDETKGFCYNGKCNVPHTLANDSPCSFDFECISDMCGCAEGCDTPRCLGVASISNDMPCDPSDPAACTSGYCGCTKKDDDDDCISAICTEAGSHGNGGSCLDEMDCVSGLRCGPSNQCIVPYSVAIGGKCTYFEDCVIGAGCDDSVCSDFSGRQCYGDEDCGNGQTCVCSGSSSVCKTNEQYEQQIKVELQVENICKAEILEFNTKMRLLCPLSLVDGNFTDLPLECQKMLANYYCCMMCNSANLGDFSKIDLTEMTISFDCVAMTVIGPNNVSECCATASIEKCIPARSCSKYMSQDHSTNGPTKMEKTILISTVCIAAGLMAGGLVCGVHKYRKMKKSKKYFRISDYE